MQPITAEQRLSVVRWVTDLTDETIFAHLYQQMMLDRLQSRGIRASRYQERPKEVSVAGQIEQQAGEGPDDARIEAIIEELNIKEPLDQLLKLVQS